MAALEHSRSLLVEAFLFIILSTTAACVVSTATAKSVRLPPLRFKNSNGQFKILQVADMHYANGQSTKCLDVFPSQISTCSDLNTTAFVKRMIKAEQPDLIVFTGDNIFGADTKDPVTSLKASFEPAISAKLPWAAVLGNHDQESILTRKQVMEHIVPMDYTLSKVNPHFHGKKIDGFGNYNLEVKGMKDSELEGKSVLNLYFLDSGDYSTDPKITGYGWIKPSQQAWFKETSAKLQKTYKSKPSEQAESAPALVYFHIPLPEVKIFRDSSIIGIKQEPISCPSYNSGFLKTMQTYKSKPSEQAESAPALVDFHIPLPEVKIFRNSSIIGIKQEPVGCPSYNSGFLETMVQAGDVKAAFTGHDHLNDFCGSLRGIELCYAGGFGYHAYGKAGWPRRTRVVVASLEKDARGDWKGVHSITTWKRLDDEHLSKIDTQTLWTKTRLKSF